MFELIAIRMWEPKGSSNLPNCHRHMSKVSSICVSFKWCQNCKSL